jgi:hypothetical protein
MLSDIFFLEIDPQELVDKIWGSSYRGDPSEFYSDSSSSADWALFIGQLFEVEYYILDGVANEYYEFDSPSFFAYVTINGDTFDVSGFHPGHEGIVNDNEFYPDRYGEVTHRKATKQEVIKMVVDGKEDVEYLMNALVVEN